LFAVFYLGVYAVLFLWALAGGGTLVVAASTAFALLSMVPAWAVAVRRLHDTGRSGWWLLIGVVPFVDLVILYMHALPGTNGPNQYGPDPLTGDRPNGEVDRVNALPETG
jgi:uncharacterized membrane protein YhaH (DUF805 family)